MKARSGFVSNSSSSSFILAFKGELTKDRLMKWLDIEPMSFLYSFCEQIANFILDDTIIVETRTISDFVKESGFADKDEAFLYRHGMREIELLELGYTIRTATLEDYGRSDVESWLAHQLIAYRSESNDLIIENVR